MEYSVDVRELLGFGTRNTLMNDSQPTVATLGGATGSRQVVARLFINKARRVQ
jgi:hypothetical protein